MMDSQHTPREDQRQSASRADGQIDEIKRQIKRLTGEKRELYGTLEEKSSIYIEATKSYNDEYPDTIKLLTNIEEYYNTFHKNGGADAESFLSNKISGFITQCNLGYESANNLATIYKKIRETNRFILDNLASLQVRLKVLGGKYPDQTILDIYKMIGTSETNTTEAQVEQEIEKHTKDLIEENTKVQAENAKYIDKAASCKSAESNLEEAKDSLPASITELEEAIKVWTPTTKGKYNNFSIENLSFNKYNLKKEIKETGRRIVQDVNQFKRLAQDDLVEQWGDKFVNNIALEYNRGGTDFVIKMIPNALGSLKKLLTNGSEQEIKAAHEKLRTIKKDAKTSFQNLGEIIEEVKKLDSDSKSTASLQSVNSARSFSTINDRDELDGSLYMPYNVSGGGEQVNYQQHSDRPTRIEGAAAEEPETQDKAGSPAAPRRKGSSLSPVKEVNEDDKNTKPTERDLLSQGNQASNAAPPSPPQQLEPRAAAASTEEEVAASSGSVEQDNNGCIPASFLSSIGSRDGSCQIS